MMKNKVISLPSIMHLTLSVLVLLPLSLRSSIILSPLRFNNLNFYRYGATFYTFLK